MRVATPLLGTCRTMQAGCTHRHTPHAAAHAMLNQRDCCTVCNISSWRAREHNTFPHRLCTVCHIPTGTFARPGCPACMRRKYMWPQRQANAALCLMHPACHQGARAHCAEKGSACGGAVGFTCALHVFSLCFPQARAKISTAFATTFTGLATAG